MTAKTDREGHEGLFAAFAAFMNCGFASWAAPNPTTGAHTGDLVIDLHPDWDTFTSESVTRTFVHEMGHFLGLDNYDSDNCGVDDAMMNDQFECGPFSTPDSGVTKNDYEPVNETVYGDSPRTTCGWPQP